MKTEKNKNIIKRKKNSVEHEERNCQDKKEMYDEEDETKKLRKTAKRMRKE